MTDRTQAALALPPHRHWTMRKHALAQTQVNLEGLAMVFDLGGFLHPQPPVLGDFNEDAAEAGSDWASVIPGYTPLPPERPEARSRTPGQDQDLPN